MRERECACSCAHWSEAAGPPPRERAHPLADGFLEAADIAAPGRAAAAARAFAAGNGYLPGQIVDRIL